MLIIPAFVFLASIVLRGRPVIVAAVALSTLVVVVDSAAASAKNNVRSMTRFTPSAYVLAPHFVHNTPPHGQYYWRHGHRHLAL